LVGSAVDIYLYNAEFGSSQVLRAWEDTFRKPSVRPLTLKFDILHNIFFQEDLIIGSQSFKVFASSARAVAWDNVRVWVA
jgi:hypothetical protein